MCISMVAHYPNALPMRLPSAHFLSILTVSGASINTPHIRSHQVTLPAIAKLRESGIFSDMSLRTDEDEHSIEMHLPYVRKVFAGQVFIWCFT